MFTLVSFTSVLVLSVPLPFALASSKSPYESGYDHGCDDAGISNPSNQYINQPEKGPSYHTSEFMDGYYSGLNSCGVSSGDGYYEQPQQTRQSQDTLGEDLGEVVKCAVKTAPLASAGGQAGLIIGGLGCAAEAITN